MELVVKVKNCQDCPMKKDHRGHGECWTYCSHPDKKVKAYEDILWGCQEPASVVVPKWCPLKRGK